MELVGVIIIFTVMFIQRTNQNEHFWVQLMHSLYLTYAKTIFVMGMSLAVLPSLLGVESFVHFLMDTKLFNFIAKVSFCTYLVHVIIIYQFIGKLSVDLYYSYLNEYALYAAHAVLSILWGFVLCLVVEIPFSKLQKVLMGKLMGKDRAKRENVEKSEVNINQSIKEQ